MTPIYIAVAAAVLVVAWAALTYNALVRWRNQVTEAWSLVDVQLRRRHDLVPTLLEVVRGYAEQERAVLFAAAEARAAASRAPGRRSRQASEMELSATIADLRALGEQYPELRAAEAFRRFSGQLAEVEGEIQYARRIYNSNLQLYNRRVKAFPNSIVARLGGFRSRGYFELYPVRRSVESGGTSKIVAA